MNQIFSAISKGYTSKQILDFLLRQFPQHSSKIKKALASGYTVDQIVKFLGGGREGLNRETEPSTEHEATREKDIQRRENVNKGALATTGLAAGSLAAPMAASALSRVLPHSVQSLIPGIQNAIAASSVNPSTQPSPQPQLQSPIILQKTNESQQPPILPTGASSVTQQQPNIQPEVKTLDLEPLKTKYKGFFDKINDLRNSGNDTEGIAGFFRKFSPSQSEKLEKEAGDYLEQIIEKYIAENPIRPSQEKKSPEIQKEEQKSPDLLDQARKLFKETGNLSPTFIQRKLHIKYADAKNLSDQLKSEGSEEKGTISKSETVASPQGIGEVKEVRNGQAIIDVDGKLHKVEEKNLLKPPKEAAVEALELIKSFTPEEMRSTHHMLNAYDDESKKGFFVFHNGSAYVVDDISPEEYKELSEEIEKAKTSGETVIGKWAQGEGSRGAAYNKVVKGVRERKVVPELKKKYKKLRVGYNLLAEWQKLLGEHERETR